jgi:hypothetical protein
VARFVQTISKETSISWRFVKLIMAAVDISDQRRRQFVGIDLGEQWNLTCLENVAHGFEFAARRCANAASFAKVKLNHRS